jgi:hypothetical protein
MAVCCLLSAGFGSVDAQSHSSAGAMCGFGRRVDGSLSVRSSFTGGNLF